MIRPGLWNTVADYGESGVDRVLAVDNGRNQQKYVFKPGTELTIPSQAKPGATHTITYKEQTFSPVIEASKQLSVTYQGVHRPTDHEWTATLKPGETRPVMHTDQVQHLLQGGSPTTTYLHADHTDIALTLPHVNFMLPLAQRTGYQHRNKPVTPYDAEQVSLDDITNDLYN